MSIEAVCIDLVEGPTPIRVVTLEIGSRRPIGLGAGGLAILAALPPEEARRVLGAAEERIQQDWGVPADTLRQALARTRIEGHSTIVNRITTGVTAIGRSLPDFT